jgi:glycosyltransferase involved in cell wall biosynthesis
LKLALIAPGGFDGSRHDGMIPALYALGQELGSRHEVHVFAASGPGPDVHRDLGAVRVHQIGDPWHQEPAELGRRCLELGRLGWQLSRQIGRAASSGRFDVLHAFWAAGPGLLTGFLGQYLRVPVVVSVGGGEAAWLPEIGYGGSGSWFGRARLALTLRAANEITVGSDFARALLGADAAARAHVVPWGVNCERFAAPPARTPGPPWRLLHVGSLNRVKDQRTLIEAFANVIARLGDVRLDCVGEDTLGGEIQRQARALGLGQRVRFLGFQSQEELAALYRDAHLFVLSSRYESQSVVVLEAAAAGLPTVGTAVGLLATLSPAAASSVAPGNPSALADAICALLLDQDRREAMGAAAQQFARAHDVAWTARTFENLYRGLVGAPGVRADSGAGVPAAPSARPTSSDSAFVETTK